jgi:hypothetical protein
VYPTLREEDRPLECVIGAFLVAEVMHTLRFASILVQNLASSSGSPTSPTTRR